MVKNPAARTSGSFALKLPSGIRKPTGGGESEAARGRVKALLDDPEKFRAHF